MWTEKLKRNPIELLINTEDPALRFFVKRDLLNIENGAVDQLLNLPIPLNLIKKQQENGSWIYKGKRPGDELGENYELLETWRKIRDLIEMYGFNCNHHVIEKGAEFIFSCQTEEGDIRGILSNQYTPYYMGAMMEVLIKAGYGDDDRIHKGFSWLEGMQQEGGGWIIPMTMFKMQEFNSLSNQAPVPPDKELPFSHMATGMVIRAYAAHPEYRCYPSAQNAGKLLKSRFFVKDTFTSRQSIDFWFKFRFPFWWTDLLTVLDSLMRLGFSADDQQIQKGLNWLIDHQGTDGGWAATYGKNKQQSSDPWVTYAVCRILKYFLI